MTMLKEPRPRSRITRDYEFESETHTRLYDYQPEDKALAMAFAAQSGPQPLQRGASTQQVETTYKSDFDEGVLITWGSVVSGSLGQERKVRKLPRPKKRLRQRSLARWIERRRGTPRLGGDRKPPKPPKAPAVVQSYKGVVESVHEGLAYLTLEARNGQRLQIEWDAAELTGWGIGERQPFILKTIEEENKLVYEFIPDRPLPLSAELRSEIDALREYYQASGQFDDDDE